MKDLNLLSLSNSRSKLSKQIFNLHLFHHKIDIKDDELEDIDKLIESLKKKNWDISIFEHFYIGYKIPQIGKEFDLLRFGSNYNINIELKRKSTDEKISKQLIKNRYFLSFLKVPTFHFTYVSSEDKLYLLEEKDDVFQVDTDVLIAKLKGQDLVTLKNIDILFEPTNYLVSPFNTTKKFINNEYFLTNHQELIKSEIIKNSDVLPAFFSIKGKAGTGKTLLVYDLAKEYYNRGLNTLVFHCGNLNDGHNQINKSLNWNIKPVKYSFNFNYKEFSVVIVDEAQRIRPNQLFHIIEQVKLNDCVCLFSYDEEQCLKKSEIENNIDKLINDTVSPISFELKNKIRTNNDLINFIDALFDKSIHKIEYNQNIEVCYFNNVLEAKQYLEYLNTIYWTVINFTESSYDSTPYDEYLIENIKNAHNVIGQEFDYVVGVIDENFYYKSDNSLSTRNYKKTPYFHPSKMLFQILTRARKKLKIVIINNDEILERCLHLLN